MTLACTSGSLSRRGAGKRARFLKSDARSSRCDPCFAKFDMNADEIDAQIRTIAAERRIPQSHLARWLAMDAASRAAMLDVARAIRLRTGQLVTAIDTLDEIAVREHVTVAAILDRAEIRRIATAPAPRRLARARCWRHFERFAFPA